MRIHVRPLAPRDHDVWHELFRDYIAFYRTEVPAEVIDLTWRRLMGEASEMLGLVAVGDDDRPVGLALLVFHRSTWSPTWYCYLEDLYVSPALRGAGVGRALIDAVYRAADERGATRTYWVTEVSNEAARRLYEKVARRAPFLQYRRA